MKIIEKKGSHILYTYIYYIVYILYILSGVVFVLVSTSCKLRCRKEKYHLIATQSSPGQARQASAVASGDVWCWCWCWQTKH